jgi:hypothetical protein
MLVIKGVITESTMVAAPGLVGWCVPCHSRTPYNTERSSWRTRTFPSSTHALIQNREFLVAAQAADGRR